MNCMPSSMTRRHWIGGALAIGALGAGPEADPRIEAIRARAKKAEMQPFDESETAHYLAIGDASGRFRTEALGVCEAVAADYLKVFQDKGFEVALPREKLVVVVLLGRNSYAQFEGGFADDAVGGHFDLDDNRLVMFDFRGTGANPKAAIPEQDNTLALVHETIHQLTYNTGLLDRKADVPLCISEGLATFGETWAPRRRHQIGERNARRLLGRAQAGKQGARWVPIADLIVDDKLLQDEKTQQLAYAQSWMLVNKLLKDRDRLPQFRDYLTALRARPKGEGRLELAARYLGDLAKLDKDVRASR